MTAGEYLVRTAGVMSGSVLIAGGIAHLRYPALSHAFMPAILRDNYRLRTLGSRVGPTVGVVELVIGTGVILASYGVLGAQVWPLVGGVFLYAMFAVFLLSRLVSRPGAPCGCSQYGRVTVFSVGRGVVLLAVSVVVGLSLSGGTMEASFGPQGVFEALVPLLSGVGAAWVVWILPDSLEGLGYEARPGTADLSRRRPATSQR